MATLRVVGENTNNGFRNILIFFLYNYYLGSNTLKEITIFQYRKARILVWKWSYPCTDMVVSLYGNARILVRIWSYPCTEMVISLYGKTRILVRKGSYPCPEMVLSLYGKDCFRTRIYNEVQLLRVGEEDTAGDHKQSIAGNLAITQRHGRQMLLRIKTAPTLPVYKGCPVTIT